MSTSTLDNNYSLNVDSFQLEQLLRVLYNQTIIQDEIAIHLISLINQELHRRSPMRNGNSNLLTNGEIDQSYIHAEETYYQYRKRHGVGQNLSAALATSPVLAATSATNLSAEPRLLPTQLPTQINQPLETIAQYLATIAESLYQKKQESQPQLGFTNLEKRITIYCQSHSVSPWYMLDDRQDVIPIAARVLTCIIQSIDMQSNTHKSKLYINLLGDKPYCLETLCYSLFSKSFLLAIASLTPQQLKEPLTLEPIPYQNQQDLLCRVYHKGTLVSNILINRTWGKHPQWTQVLQRAVENLAMAQGHIIPFTEVV